MNLCSKGQKGVIKVPYLQDRKDSTTQGYLN